MNDRETVPYKIRIQHKVEIYVPGDVLTYRSPGMYAFVGAVFGISLQRVTHSENMWHASRNGLLQTGLKHRACILSTNDVLEIRSLKGRLSYRAIARKFNVSQPHVSDIINRKVRNHVL